MLSYLLTYLLCELKVTQLFSFAPISYVALSHIKKIIQTSLWYRKLFTMNKFSFFFYNFLTKSRPASLLVPENNQDVK